MTRASASWVKFCASPHPAVNRLQIAQAAAMIETRRNRSQAQATGMPKLV